MKLIYNLDFIGKQPEFYTKGKSRHQTIIGAIFSILTAISILVLGLYFTIIVFQRKKIDVSFNKVSIAKPVLDTKYMTPAINFRKVSLLNPDIYKYMDIIGLQWNITSINEKYTPSIKFFELVPCNKEQLGNNAPFFESIGYIPRHLCIPKEIDTALTHIRANVMNKTWVQIEARPCSNSTRIKANNTKLCAPQSEINNVLKGMTMSIDWKDSYIDNNNIPNPGNSLLRGMTLKLSLMLSKTIFMRFAKVIYETDIGYVFEDKILQEYYTIDNIEKDFGIIEENNVYVRIILSNSNYEYIYKRKFLKLQNLLADLGGMIKGILIIAVLINEYFLRHLFLYHLIESIFEFKSNGGPSIIKESQNNIEIFNSSNIRINNIQVSSTNAINSSNNIPTRILPNNVFKYNEPHNNNNNTLGRADNNNNPTNNNNKSDIILSSNNDKK